jgi:outer membrane protein OmpU
MNKLKKLGFTALAGSLVMTSANAVDYTLTGDAILNYTSADSDDVAVAPSATGRGLASDTDLYFNASGELDNGFTVAFFQAADTNGAWSNSSSQVTIGMGSMGTLQYNNIAGSKANGIDDVTPFAMDEAWGSTVGLASNNPSFFGASTASGSLDYRIPTQEISGMTIDASITVDPSADVGAAGARAPNATTNSGMAYTITGSMAGFSFGAGLETVEGSNNNAAKSNGNDEESVTGYIKYANGPITVGYQEAYQNTLDGGRDLEAQMMGVAYTAGDITLSYSEQTLTKSETSDTVAIDVDLESLQLAYSMGAMTISAGMNETSNAQGTSGKTYEENELQVSFAF